MTEERYRICKLILMAVFVFGVFGIGDRISGSLRELAENGRYIQYDRQKDTVTTGNTTQTYAPKIWDTRTGAVIPN